MFQFNCYSFSNFFTTDKCTIGTQVSYHNLIAFFNNGAVFTTETLIAYADFAISAASYKNLFLGEGVSGEWLGVGNGDEGAPYLGLV
jgi:hypothetical protein